VVTRVEKAVESLSKLGGQVQEAKTLSAAHRSRLKAALAALRAQADAIEAALKEGRGGTKEAQLQAVTVGLSH
jgi:hypothetical protein